jgi:hypothetical protein
VLVLVGTLLAESLRVGAVLEVAGLTLVRVQRRDVSDSATPGQPSVWTFIDFTAGDELADQLADALSRSLLVEGGWYASFTLGDEHAVVFAGRVFRHRRGDRVRRAEIEQYAREVGVPQHQMDWGN